jgi:hypothetical protein
MRSAELSTVDREAGSIFGVASLKVVNVSKKSLESLTPVLLPQSPNPYLRGFLFPN